MQHANGHHSKAAGMLAARAIVARWPPKRLYLDEAVQAATAHSESNRYHKAKEIFSAEQAEPTMFLCACGWKVSVKRPPPDVSY